MTLRLRLEFAPELVTDDMNQLGLSKCWYEPLETTGTIGELVTELIHRFCLYIGPESELHLTSDGFTLPQSQRLSLLRDGELVLVSVRLRQNMHPSKKLKIVKSADSDDKLRFNQEDVKKRCFVCFSKFHSNVEVYLSSMREHIAGHILYGDVDDSACGFCGQIGTCSSGLDKGTAKGISRPISNCPYYYKFSNKSVHKVDSKQPRCTNAPMQCSACLPRTAYMWKYHMQSHWQAVHPEVLESFPYDYLISPEEVEAVKKRMKKRKAPHIPYVMPTLPQVLTSPEQQMQLVEAGGVSHPGHLSGAGLFPVAKASI